MPTVKLCPTENTGMLCLHGNCLKVCAMWKKRLCWARTKTILTVWFQTSLSFSLSLSLSLSLALPLSLAPCTIVHNWIQCRSAKCNKNAAYLKIVLFILLLTLCAIILTYYVLQNKVWVARQIDSKSFFCEAAGKVPHLPDPISSSVTLCLGPELAQCVTTMSCCACRFIVGLGRCCKMSELMWTTFFWTRDPVCPFGAVLPQQVLSHLWETNSVHDGPRQ